MRREVWLGLAGAGILMMLPLSWITLLLLLVIPGLAILLLLKDRVNLTELIGVSGTISVLFFPMAILFISPISVRFAGIFIGLIVLAAGLYGFLKKKNITVDTSDWQVQVIAALIFLIVLIISMKTFVIDDRGLVLATTHASDLNWHLSISQRYATDPLIPPQDPYLPGSLIVYNWFMQVTFGELTLLTGVGLFEVLKLVVCWVSMLVFLDACLLARILFSDDQKAALLGGIIYVAGSGLAWLYLIYLTVAGQSIDLFKVVIYEWSGIMQLKYDSTALYFFLPQTQTFGLLAMIFGLYIYLETVNKKKLSYAIVAGLSLASLVLYHVITAFPVLVALGLFFMYLLFRERKDLVKNRDMKLLLIYSLPLIIAAIGGVYEIHMMSSNAGSQITLGQDKDIYQTIFFTIGLLIPFALAGMYLARDSIPARLLVIFAVLNFIFLNIFQMTMTHNTYRFLVYLTLPVALFAGLALSRWLFSPKKWKIAIAAVVILTMIPTTVCIIMFYNDSSYVHATPADVKALEWIKDNTPINATFYEEPSHFVRLPVMTGRQDAYAGQIYTWQYHNVDRQQEMEAILRVSDKDALYSTLLVHQIDYVFVGSKEAGYPFAEALKGNPGLTEVYSEDGVKIYRVNRP